jgi:TonB-dependent starch-binding outer membrane protein SusC
MIVRCKSRPDSKNILLAMKMTAVIMLVACLHASAGSFSQSVTLQADNMPLKEVLLIVKQQTGYSFFFKKGTLDQTRPVTLQVQNMPLATFLDTILKDQPLKYELSVKTITLLPKPANLISYNRQQHRWAYFQEINGLVTGEGNTPLTGASIKVKGMQAGTHTDTLGRFTINAEPGQVLVISFVGYVNRQIKISKETSLIIQLQLAETSLDEVVVNKGYYTEKQRLSVGNVSSIKAADIERQPVGNPLAAMQGRIPGMVITQSTGVPGSAFRVQIRGKNSIAAGNDPLYVVDGVPYPASLLNGMFSVNGDITIGGSPLASINPQDIESIDVLKDADATGIYGARGANGVVLITTKKGKAGDMRVNMNVQQGIGKVGKFMKLLNTRQYLDMRYEAFRNDKVDLTLPSTIAPDLKYYDTTRYTDWQKELIGGSASYTDAQASVSGGNTTAQYLVGGNYHRETTVFPGNHAYERGAMHFNLSGNSKDQRFRIMLTGGYTADKNNLPRTDLMDYALNLPPTGPAIYNKDGSLNWANGEWQNPIARMRGTYKRRVNNFTGSLVLSYQIMKGLEFRSTFGYNRMTVDETSIYPISSYNPTSGVLSGYAEFGNFVNRTYNIEPQLSYTRDLWKGRLSVLAGTTYQKNMTDGLGVNSSGYVSDALLGSLLNAGTITPWGTQSRSYKYSSLYGRINYNIADKYLINFTGRRDGSDRFGSANRFGNFGSVGIGWIFSKENLFADHLSFISFGKLRASYGTVGNDGIDTYQWIRTYSIGSNAPVFQNVRGLVPNNLENPNYKWEENRKLEAGLELGFLSDHITTSISYYRNRSGNQLVQFKIPAQTGFSFIIDNFPALVENRGWEVTLNVNNVKLGPVKWYSYFNISWNRNELKEFPNLEANGNYRTSLTVGKPLDLYRLYDYAGVDPATGLFQFTTKAGKLVDNLYPNYLTFGTDQTVLLNRQPDYFGGWQNNFSYKGFELNFTFQYAKQIGKGYRAAFIPGAGSGTQGNQPVEILDRWQKPGDIAKYARFNANRANGNNNTGFDGSSGNYVDASFIRMKNVQLAYDLMNVIGKRIHLQQMKIYLQGQNIFTITDYLGMDPENQSGTSLPPLRVLTAGITITL